jgi:hypothetical protein
MSGTQIEEATALVTGGNRGFGRAVGAGAAHPRRYQGLRDLALTPAADRGARRPARARRHRRRLRGGGTPGRGRRLKRRQRCRPAVGDSRT